MMHKLIAKTKIRTSTKIQSEIPDKELTRLRRRYPRNKKELNMQSRYLQRAKLVLKCRNKSKRMLS
jgi:hypothetical protein